MVSLSDSANGSPLTINGGVAGGWLNKNLKDYIESRALQTLLPPQLPRPKNKT